VSSKFDKLKDSFGILTTPKDTKEPKEENKQVVATKEESVEEEVQRYFSENSTDLLQSISSEPKGRSIDGRNIRVNNSKRIRIYEPSKFNDVKAIGEEIKNGKIVVVNFKNLDEDESIRVENFLYGMCYCADIEPEAVHDGIISIDPQHTTIKK